MPQPLPASPAASLVELLLGAARRQVLDRAVFSKCRDKAVRRYTLTPCLIKGEMMLQLETLRAATVADTTVNRHTPTQASQENLLLAAAEARIAALVAVCDQVNLMTSAGQVELRRSKGGKETVTGAAPLRRVLEGDAPTPSRITLGGNDRKKRHILTGEEPFLFELGVSDANGRVHDKKQAKYRQINRFLELIRDVEGALPAEGELHIADLCCGKSYLSFAVYHYFTAIRGRDVRMVGVDMKADVMADCDAIARKLGMAGLAFLCADVGLYEFGDERRAPDAGAATAGEEAGAGAETVHMVISLHACDTATDLVLRKAVEWRARVVLATPCCHHELNRRLDAPAMGFIAEHSMLRQKLCDAATDALRLKWLEASGYEVAALELIDPEETPKNIMLRGVRKYDPASSRCQKAARAYAEAYTFLTGKEPPEV